MNHAVSYTIFTNSGISLSGVEVTGKQLQGQKYLDPQITFTFCAPNYDLSQVKIYIKC